LLTQFGVENFKHDQIFEILGNFIWITSLVNLIFLLKDPLFLRRKPATQPGQRSQSMMSRDSMGSTVDTPAVPVEPEVLRRRSTRQSELVKPLLFMRESSVTGRNSKLSINLSQVGEENTDRGPTLLFKEVTYVMNDSKTRNKKKIILNRVSGKFDWGKLSMVIGGAGSGKTSLLHILAGDIALGSEVHGQITFNGRPADPNQPLWQRCGFVALQNELIRDLTVKQVLMFAMKLRCLNRFGLAVLEENVQKTIEILHLEE
jgi:ABC-type glutathione transport system ATPase component